MDPISAIFASYLDVVSTLVSQRYLDVTGTEVKSVVVQHNGTQVPYAYQRWKIQPKSVCQSYTDNIETFSSCTLAAKSLFTNACDHLQKNPANDWRHRSLQNMYCTAAVSYQPTVANIGWSSDAPPLDEARTECNLAIAALVGNSDSAARQRKKEACDRYDAMKAGR